MIIKKYEPREQSDPRLAAGVRAEKQMAHYLDRHFGPAADFLLLHDLRIGFEGEAAQIDHLVLHPYGAALVESKSVSSAVRINARGEWERQNGRSWSGMPDPLLQAERQALLLKRLLESRTDELLDKLMGLVQTTFRNMALDTFAAISDGGKIERARPDQAPGALKADAVPAAIAATFARYRRGASLLNWNLKETMDAPRDFKLDELRRIARFLAAQHRPLRAAAAGRTKVGAGLVPCKYCASLDVGLPRRGRYGPYVVCNECGKNTSLQRPGS